jgi:hypothetical protein
MCSASTLAGPTRNRSVGQPPRGSRWPLGRAYPRLAPARRRRARNPRKPDASGCKRLGEHTIASQRAGPQRSILILRFGPVPTRLPGVASLGRRHRQHISNAFPLDQVKPALEDLSLQLAVTLAAIPVQDVAGVSNTSLARGQRRRRSPRYGPVLLSPQAARTGSHHPRSGATGCTSGSLPAPHGHRPPGHLRQACRARTISSISRTCPASMWKCGVDGRNSLSRFGR